MDEETLYTVGVWTVVPGMEALFIAAGTEMANWTRASCDGANTAFLLQDNSDDKTFYQLRLLALR